MVGFTVSPEIANLIDGADRSKDAVRFTLDGDLSQMSRQEQFLKSRGFTVGRNNVYPGLYTEEDFERALRVIWQFKIAGWWHYQTQYLKYQICTENDFTTALDIECAK